MASPSARIPFRLLPRPRSTRARRGSRLYLQVFNIYYDTGSAIGAVVAYAADVFYWSPPVCSIDSQFSSHWLL